MVLSALLLFIVNRNGIRAFRYFCTLIPVEYLKGFRGSKIGDAEKEKKRDKIRDAGKARKENAELENGINITDTF